MRDTLAAVDPGFVLALASPKSERREDRLAGAIPRGSTRGRRPPRRLVPWLAGGLGIATAAGILINALALQDARHPSPLFARAVPLSPAPARTTSKPVPVRAPRPTFDDAARATARDKPLEKVPASTAAPEKAESSEKLAALRPHQSAASQGEEAPAARPDDPISRLLKGQIPESSPGDAGEPSKTVLAAQKALAKLGYVVKADGLAGAATHQAIERFERDRKLPAHGELTPKLLRRLSAESGIAID